MGKGRGYEGGRCVGATEQERKLHKADFTYEN